MYFCVPILLNFQLDICLHRYIVVRSRVASWSGANRHLNWIASLKNATCSKFLRMELYFLLLLLLGFIGWAIQGSTTFKKNNEQTNLTKPNLTYYSDKFYFVTIKKYVFVQIFFFSNCILHSSYELCNIQNDCTVLFYPVTAIKYLIH